MVKWLPVSRCSTPANTWVSAVTSCLIGPSMWHYAWMYVACSLFLCVCSDLSHWLDSVTQSIIGRVSSNITQRKPGCLLHGEKTNTQLIDARNAWHFKRLVTPASYHAIWLKHVNIFWTLILSKITLPKKSSITQGRAAVCIPSTAIS